VARLLILGPNGAFNATLGKLLERAGHSVEASGSSPVDVWLVDGEPPEILVVDAMWPHGDQRSYFLAVQAEPALGNVPRVLLTSDARRQPRIIADGLGCSSSTARKLLDVEACLLLLARAALGKGVSGGQPNLEPPSA